LLDQALAAVKQSAYSSVLSNVTEFRFRIISGHQNHDRPVNIKPEDDIIQLDTEINKLQGFYPDIPVSNPEIIPDNVHLETLSLGQIKERDILEYKKNQRRGV
jgi:hypothetical protein